MSVRALVGAVVLGLGLGMVVGFQQAGGDEPPPPEYIVRVVERKVVVHETKEVKVPVKETVTVVPEPCKRVASLGKQLAAAVDKYEAAAGKQRELIDQTFTAIQMKSIPELNRAIEKNRALKNDLLDPLMQVAHIRKQLDAASAECDAASR